MTACRRNSSHGVCQIHPGALSKDIRIPKRAHSVPQALQNTPCGHLMQAVCYLGCSRSVPFFLLIFCGNFAVKACAWAFPAVQTARHCCFCSCIGGGCPTSCTQSILNTVCGAKPAVTMPDGAGNSVLNAAYLLLWLNLIWANEAISLVRSKILPAVSV